VSDDAPVTRLAPSPTGLLHVGHARSFLVAWWYARARGGRVLLRIEDLDGARSRPELVRTALEDLAWLGLDWDGPTLVQSADPRPYVAAVERLERAGRAYPCVCTRREIEAVASAPHAGDAEPRYDGRCRERFASRAEAERTSGRAAGVRFRVPPGAVAVEDLRVGAYARDVQADVGDFLVLRRDGCWAYQLAVVVDDARTGVTHVVRGDDLLPSTPRQALLLDALGLPRPAWVHLPLVVDEHGARLSKRDRSLALASLRERGVDPRALVAWAARSAGVAGLPPEARASAAELVGRFDLARLPAEPAVFGPAELARLERPGPDGRGKRVGPSARGGA